MNARFKHKGTISYAESYGIGSIFGTYVVVELSRVEVKKGC